MALSYRERKNRAHILHEKLREHFGDNPAGYNQISLLASRMRSHSNDGDFPKQFEDDFNLLVFKGLVREPKVGIYLL